MVAYNTLAVGVAVPPPDDPVVPTLAGIGLAALLAAGERTGWRWPLVMEAADC